MNGSSSSSPAIKIKPEPGLVPVKPEPGLAAKPDAKPDAKPEPRRRPLLQFPPTAELDAAPLHAGKKLWLVKVPRFLSQHLSSHPPGADLGELVVEKGADGKSRIRIEVPSAPQGTPSSYECALREGQPAGYAFAEDGRGAGTRVAGRIVRELNARPALGEDYLSMIRARTALKPEWETGFIGDEEANRIAAVGMQVGRRDDGFTKARRPAPRNVNARVEDVGELFEMIMGAFRDAEYWASDSLADTLKQPKQFVRENLPTMAVQEKGGPYAGMWKLKPEHRAFLNGEQEQPAMPEEEDEDLEDDDEEDPDDEDPMEM
ncbi:transcription initiation factor IIF, beta subunit-domain-containing protein [Hyaloraphidium curvatum]|nr:transcription initiation factor IIF, beta subunit-domain-containing protein [Hyaloraphidium curvatum]